MVQKESLKNAAVPTRTISKTALWRICPLWLRIAAIVAILGTLASCALPEDLFSFDTAPSYMLWLLLPHFLVFYALCAALILFGVDPLAHGASLLLLNSVANLAIFIVCIMYGAIIGLVVHGILWPFIRARNQESNPA